MKFCPVAENRSFLEIVFSLSPPPLTQVHPPPFQSNRTLCAPHDSLRAQNPHHAPLQPQFPLNRLRGELLPVAQIQHAPQRVHIHEPSSSSSRFLLLLRAIVVVVVPRRPRGRNAGGAGEISLRVRGEAGPRGEDLQGWVVVGGELGEGGGGWLLVMMRGGRGGGDGGGV